MDKESKAYLSEEFPEMFQEAEIGNMVAEDVVLYSQSKMKFDETLATIDYAARKNREEGLEEGRKEGREEGRKEGIEEERYNIARNMVSLKIPAEIIIQSTGLPLSEVEAMYP